MALSEDEEDAFYIFGTATITATACSIEVASTADCAMHPHGPPTNTRVDGEDTSGINASGTYCQPATAAIDQTPTQLYTGDIQATTRTHHSRTPQLPRPPPPHPPP